MDEQKSGGRELLLIKGSPRKKGVTAALADMLLREAALLDKNIQSTIIDSYALGLKPCTHCGYCQKKSGCVQSDFLPVDAALQRADLLVIASPVYVLGFPAPLKALLDRSQQYFEARASLGIIPIKKPKSALFLSAYGSADARGVHYMEEQLKLVFKVFNAELKGTIAAHNTDSGDVDFNSLGEEIKKALALLLDQSICGIDKTPPLP
ncbi:putative NADPH-dependent fmn reductase [Treponema primitia ZAS-2]|uniref:Putative NADPH-dependent fmn reductase n=1 Tax=Treponema primitia (strain ATCC BAA-887 / DSM 12427 / ZAS-2) TaxID=545694 RepID=F5YNV5_TREPZ|nr:flavodoxin family protein [Treponema primitia]AEF85039.1 putative NADPH-dependent fmn reductase [Treponema primitia ZAS-2]